MPPWLIPAAITAIGTGASLLASRTSNGGGAQPLEKLPSPETPFGERGDARSINSVFGRVLGRPANQEELNHFSTLINRGDISHLMLSRMLEGTSEFQESGIRRRGGELETLLGASDEDILGRAEKQLGARFQRLGRGDTSALGSAFAQTSGRLAGERRRELSNFFSPEFQRLGRQEFSRGQESRGRADTLRSSFLQRLHGVQDFNTGGAIDATRRSENREQARQNAFFDLAGSFAQGGLQGIGFAQSRPRTQGLTPAPVNTSTSFDDRNFRPR